MSTHSSDEFDDALDQLATYFSAGPIIATPAKPGRAGRTSRTPVSSQARMTDRSSTGA